MTQVEPAKDRSGVVGRPLPESRDEGLVHPGMLHNQAELDFVRDKVRAKGSLLWYVNGETGQNQESGRDQYHAFMGLGFLTAACEIAWKQGVDLYAAHDNRLVLGLEYTAKYNLGNEVPFEEFITYDGRPTNGKRISSRGRGRFYPMWKKATIIIMAGWEWKCPTQSRSWRKSGPKSGMSSSPSDRASCIRICPFTQKGTSKILDQAGNIES